MNEFPEQLRRFKQSTGLREDRDVAKILGLTKAALSARKVRGSFPVDKVKLLAADRPDLGLDVKYILTGISAELERRLKAIRRSAKGIVPSVSEESARYGTQVGRDGDMEVALSSDERQLLHYFRQANSKARALLLASALAFAGDATVAPSRKAHRRK